MYKEDEYTELKSILTKDIKKEIIIHFLSNRKRPCQRGVFMLPCIWMKKTS